MLAVGRRPTKHLNLPSRLRARTLPSGRTYYYYDTGEKPRREIPLGSDYALAVKKWAELEIDARPRHAEIVTFRYVAERYQREVLPTKATAHAARQPDPACAALQVLRRAAGTA